MTYPKNVLGGELESCGKDPVTGFFRNGFCDTCDEDLGVHSVCCKVTEEFLKFCKISGNDLSTPHPELNFPGLKPGDQWCVCAARWKQAYEAGYACPVILKATHIETLKIIPLDILRKYAV